ncbi:DMT family transporter [Arhodomonas aquaeolei]|uniref:DMT family transporter n=1 Tax=Arhodomonas aquaeolei TaxID=2369 RepID=UPI00036C4705|nr:multidrug efflux SMR transporter [Arhodomonas aquaeolei]
MNALIWLAVAITSEVIATTALKASDGFSRPGPSAIVVAGYALAFVLLSMSLKHLPVGYVYALWAGLGMVGVAITGALVFGETFPLAKAGGIALIVAGVVMLNLPAARG